MPGSHRRDRTLPDAGKPCTIRSTGLGQRQYCHGSSADLAGPSAWWFNLAVAIASVIPGRSIAVRKSCGRSQRLGRRWRKTSRSSCKPCSRPRGQPDGSTTSNRVWSGVWKRPRSESIGITPGRCRRCSALSPSNSFMVPRAECASTTRRSWRPEMLGRHTALCRPSRICEREVRTVGSRRRHPDTIGFIKPCGGLGTTDAFRRLR